MMLHFYKRIDDVADFFEPDHHAPGGGAYALHKCASVDDAFGEVFFSSNRRVYMAASARSPATMVVSALRILNEGKIRHYS